MSLTPFQLQTAGSGFTDNKWRWAEFRDDRFSNNDARFGKFTPPSGVGARNPSTISSTRFQPITDELGFWSSPNGQKAFSGVQFQTVFRYLSTTGVVWRLPAEFEAVGVDSTFDIGSWRGGGRFNGRAETYFLWPSRNAVFILGLQLSS